ncbi:hypothetical protein R6Q57_024664 [Mikania cordata]
MCSKRSEEPEEEEEENCSPRFDEHHRPSVIVQHRNMGIHDYSYTSSPIMNPQQQPWILPQVFHHSSPEFPAAGDHIFPPPPSGRRVPSAAAGGLQFAYELGTTSSSDHNLRLISETLGQMVQPSSTMPFGLQAEMGRMTAQEIIDAKALAASKSHSEAERRRRERINNHLARLHKASLLAEVIQHVKELKRQTSIIAEQSPVPTETDELTIDNTSDEQGNFVIRASLCCEDRSDLLPDLIKTLKALRLRTLKAEITTLGGRMKNVLFITGDQDSNNNEAINYSINMIQEAFKAVMVKTNGDHESSSGSVKRQRTNNINALDHRRT